MTDKIRHAVALTLRAFAYVWGFAVGVSILIGLVGIWWKSGWREVQAIFSPFNLWNWGLILLLITPAIGANILADRLSRPPK